MRRQRENRIIQFKENFQADLGQEAGEVKAG
jgi:hypothetical protein